MSFPFDWNYQSLINYPVKMNVPDPLTSEGFLYEYYIAHKKSLESGVFFVIYTSLLVWIFFSRNQNLIFPSMRLFIIFKILPGNNAREERSGHKFCDYKKDLNML